MPKTLSLILPETDKTSDHSLTQWITLLIEMKSDSEEEKKQKILYAWSQLDRQERFVFNKLITGGFRVGISKNLIIRSLAEATDQESTEIAHRLMGNWDPATTSYQSLILEKDEK